jgi:heme-degrading monooxygenase HmoA
MPYMMIRHKVADFARWKPVFDQHGATRAANGSKGGQLFRSAGDPNEVVILFEWDTHENARKFTQSDDLRAAMKRAGVADTPDLYFLDQVERVKQ